MWVQCDDRRWFCNRKPKMKSTTLHQQLFSFLLAAWSLLLTSSVCVASQAMQPRLVELWKCRVQHLRQYYSMKKVKQKGHPVITCSVWYFPVLLMGWLVILTSSVLLALQVDIMLRPYSGTSCKLCS